MLRVHVLGPLRVEADGTAIDTPGGRRAAALLAWLALHPGRHGRADLAARFWPDVLDSSARASLRTAVWSLRRALGPAGAVVAADGDRVGLEDGGALWVDARAFEELVASGRAEEAVALCDGDLLEGLDEDWAAEARAAHRERLGAVLEGLARDAEAAGDGEAALRWTRRQTDLDRFDEEAHRRLMRRLTAAGQRAAAVAVLRAAGRAPSARAAAGSGPGAHGRPWTRCAPRRRRRARPPRPARAAARRPRAGARRAARGVGRRARRPRRRRDDRGRPGRGEDPPRPRAARARPRRRRRHRDVRGARSRRRDRRARRRRARTLGRADRRPRARGARRPAARRRMAREPRRARARPGPAGGCRRRRPARGVARPRARATARGDGRAPRVGGPHAAARARARGRPPRRHREPRAPRVRRPPRGAAAGPPRAHPPPAPAAPRGRRASSRRSAPAASCARRSS